MKFLLKTIGGNFVLTAVDATGTVSEETVGHRKTGRSTEAKNQDERDRPFDQSRRDLPEV